MILMEEVSEVVDLAVNNTGNSNIIINIIMLIVAIVFVAEHIKKLIEMFGIEFKSTKREQFQLDSIKLLKGEIENIKNDEGGIKSTLEDMNKEIKTIFKELTDMKERQDIISRSRIKDRVSQSFKYYRDRDKDKSVIQWTSMEKESMMDLIDSYERAGGQNSFIHTVILPEIKNWEVIE